MSDHVYTYCIGCGREMRVYAVSDPMTGELWPDEDPVCPRCRGEEEES